MALALKFYLNSAYVSEKAAAGIYVHIAKIAEKAGNESAALMCKKLSKSEKAHADMLKSCLDELSNKN
ncbi:MAG: hypothetical protein LIO62_08770 [Clostridiales bacterium]|nr:hypothetical protein [Clostridiales bacterium]